jgi:hypothetical protein
VLGPRCSVVSHYLTWAAGCVGVSHTLLPLPLPPVFVGRSLAELHRQERVRRRGLGLDSSLRAVRPFLIMIRTEDEMSRNVGESQPLLRFGSGW